LSVSTTTVIVTTTRRTTTIHFLIRGSSLCCLYTDVSNPSSNSIYKKLGYEVVGESAQYSFR
jgi:predicted GNAT family acetyltransferase